ncbi:sigma-54 interaction domain-containing protein [Pseudomonas qingdaonensis]|uniref:sigma-54 interaction domain-containing protein n=1 Tax=Pseudomonas qingdaonensis TaxID=2056231 RepID=UPI000C283AEC|nr:sigma-54 dependent transcriptional regulator [Pseudomonas qingdaonensis]
MSLITHPHARELSKSVRATVLVFKDPRSQELLARIERLAPSEANTLIIGETGTGKELVARHIHQLSRRGREPFVAVNCGAFAETLVESELFGHEKGAFTGATNSKAGWFEAANGGTLFLDEIGDLPLNMQVKLLRVLQEREVVRLGSRTPIPINVRLVAATNVNLADAVVAGHFREDLFYRLHVATIRLPPLRERPGDILPLAEFFLEEHCQRLGYSRASLSLESERKLLGHSWPGNIRELENAIHHALLVCRQQVVQPADLHLVDMRSVGIRQEESAQPLRLQTPEAPSLEAALTALFEQNVEDLYEHIEETVFRTAYRYCHGNQLQTGRLLNISRNIVRARLEKIGELKRSDTVGL